MELTFTHSQADILLQELRKRDQEQESEADLGKDEFFSLTSRTCRLFRVESLTYEKDFPRQEAFENVIASINSESCRLVYYLRGVTNSVEFYIGVVNTSGNRAFNIGDYATMLCRAFKGNFLGSKLKEVKHCDVEMLLGELGSENTYFSALLGVPTRNSDREDITFQGVDRLINIMTSEHTLRQNFHLLVIWSSVSRQYLHKFEKLAQDTYSSFSLLSKNSYQDQSQKNEQTCKSEQRTHTTEKSEQRTKGSSSESHTGSTNESVATLKGESSSESTTKTTGTSREEQNKLVLDAMEYIDKELLPRIRRGLAKGMYQTAVYVGAETPLNRNLLANALMSLCQGDRPTFSPLRIQPLPRNDVARSMLKGLGIREGIEESSFLRFLFESRFALHKKSSLATLLTAAEISMLAGIPQKEVPGLDLREQVGFGLNLAPIAPENALPIGDMKQEGNLLSGRIVSLDRRELSKHVFIAGSTGSGKTTTCHKLLGSSVSLNKGALPFLVIEPAKTEYRALLRDRSLNDLTIFTVGSERGVPFRFNPFEFLEQESLSGHVDLLKACFMASFDMDAAIPNLLEEGLYRAYEAYGWDFRNENNIYLQDRTEAWHCGGCYFPTISSYIDIVLALVDEKGFDERLKNDYKGSLRARLDSLRAGAKGLMLDTPLSVDFSKLIEKNVILELEQLKSSEDKSFLMGLILGRVAEVLKQRHSIEPDFCHVTLLEEAHRLLSRPMPGDSPNRKLGVETFTDLLAEIRKYGESLIIVDQIPNKLAPEVLKNTNTKIIHKLFARDDKEAVGDTMALDDKQKAYLSHLEPGEAIVFSQGWNKPVNVQISPLHGVSTMDEDVLLKDVQTAGWKYWEKFPFLFCPGLPEKGQTMSREMILSLLDAQHNFWKALIANIDWRPAWRKLGEILGNDREEYLSRVFMLRSPWWKNNAKDAETAQQSQKDSEQIIRKCVKALSNVNDDNYKEKIVFLRNLLTLS